MKIGLQLPRFDWPGGAATLGADLAATARAADAAGYASLWVMDHLFQMDRLSRAEDFMLEGYTALGFLAGVTQRLRLGTMVTAAIYRHPGLLVKAVTSLDVLSGGRSWFGVGTGWYEREAHGLGLPFPPLKERFERLEETLQIALKMWSGDETAYAGKHYQLAEPLNRPQALSRPHPPILIGGLGEQKTLRMVAQYADACNLFAHIGDAELARKLAILDQHCADLGRDPAAIERTVLVPVRMYPNTAGLIAQCRTWAGLGISHAILSDVPDVHDPAVVERLGRELVATLAEV